MKEIILASGSIRRRELLEQLGVEFEVIKSNFDESGVTCSDVREYVQELAIAKAVSVVAGLERGLVIGSDTIVEIEGEILGKPKNKEDAKRIIKLLLGSRHRVVTGVAIVEVESGRREVGYEESFVTFREASEEEIEKYLDTDVWKDKAGGYSIQRERGKFMTKLEGSFTNVGGFPVFLVSEMLGRFGVKIEVDVVEKIEKVDIEVEL